MCPAARWRGAAGRFGLNEDQLSGMTTRQGTSRMPRPFFALALAGALGTLGALGCPEAKRGPSAVPVSPPATFPSRPDPAPPQPAPAPPPTEIELATRAAESAESTGDHATAVELYEKASLISIEAAEQAEIRYRLGLLRSDPENPLRDLEKSQADLHAFLLSPVPHPRAREARVILALLAEMHALQTRSTEIQAELDKLKEEVAALKAKLEEKEKELADIKKVLLQDGKKP